MQFRFLLWVVMPALVTSLQQKLPQTADGVHTIALSRQYVPVMGDGNRTVGHKAAYFGTIFVGKPEPQALNVLFDTGSGHVILPSTLCGDDACATHTRYNSSRSTSVRALDMHGDVVADTASERDEVQIQFGTGTVTGQLAEEHVCLASTNDVADDSSDCVRVRVVLATKMSTEPFAEFAFDGVLGLGLEALPIDPAFSFVGRLAGFGRLASPVFSVYFAPSEREDIGGELTFGGFNSQRALTPFQWAPAANPEGGYWQVAVRALRIGDETTDLCDDGTCRAIVDSGTSLLGVPRSGASVLNRKLARIMTPSDDMDCRKAPGEPIVFELGDIEIEIGAEDYSRPMPVAMRTGSGPIHVCRASLMPVDLGDGGKVFLFGEPVLRKYYTSYDWDKKRIGFAHARHVELV